MNRRSVITRLIGGAARHAGPWLAACAVMWLTAIAPAGAQVVHTTREEGYIVAAGHISTEGWFDDAAAVVMDFGSYSAWALRYMDGNDPGSLNDWVHFKEFRYQRPDRMVLVYDMNRGWPLNSKNNVADFHVEYVDGGNTILFTLNQPPFGLDDARLRLVLNDPESIVFRIEIRLWWIVEALMDMDGFQWFLEDRVAKMQTNIRDRAFGRL